MIVPFDDWAHQRSHSLINYSMQRFPPPWALSGMQSLLVCSIVKMQCIILMSLTYWFYYIEGSWSWYFVLTVKLCSSHTWNPRKRVILGHLLTYVQEKGVKFSRIFHVFVSATWLPRGHFVNVVVHSHGFWRVWRRRRGQQLKSWLARGTKGLVIMATGRSKPRAIATQVGTISMISKWQ